MKLNLFSKLLFAALLAFTVNSFVYFSFANVYSSSILNYQSFQDQFHSGIYQYRILSAQFLIAIHYFLSTLNIDYQIFKLKFISLDSEPQMYLSFYLLNTFFLMLTSALMVLITESKNFIAMNSEKVLLIAIGIFVITLSQFVIVPYDVSSYFFILLFFLFAMKYVERNSPINLIILCAILIISTINRESSALSIALIASLLFSKFGLKKQFILPVAILGTIFVVTYLGMRLMNESFTTNDGNLFVQNFTQPKNILGLLFWILFFAFTLILAKDRKALNHILLFHLFSIPYIVMCFYTGILYEIRLYIPLFLTSIFLSKTEVPKIH